MYLGTHPHTEGEGRTIGRNKKHLTALLTDPITCMREEKVGFPVSNYLIQPPPTTHTAATDPVCVQEYLGKIYSVNQIKSRLDAWKNRIFWWMLGYYSGGQCINRAWDFAGLTGKVHLNFLMQILLRGCFAMCLISQLTVKFPKSEKRGVENWGIAKVSILFLLSAA